MAASSAKTNDWARRIGLDEKSAKRLDERAAYEDRSVASLIRRAVLAYLDQVEQAA